MNNTKLAYFVKKLEYRLYVKSFHVELTKKETMHKKVYRVCGNVPGPEYFCIILSSSFV